MNTCIGIDIGYGNTKYASTDGNGNIEKSEFKSIVAQGESVPIAGCGFATSVETVDFDGATYWVGVSAGKHSATQLNTNDKGWIQSVAYKILVKQALLKAIENRDTSGTIEIVTGLPVKYFKTDKDKVAKVIGEVASSIGLKHRITVIYQPIGTFMNLLLDPKGGVPNEKKKYMSGRIGVLDIGFYTSDLVTIQDRAVVAEMSKSVEGGISGVLDKIRRDIEESDEFDQRPTSLLEVEEAVRSNFKIKVFGEERCMREVASNRLKNMVAELTSCSHEIWHNGTGLDSLIISGGGGALLEPYWKLYRHAEVASAANLANAVGYCKYAVRQAKRA